MTRIRVTLFSLLAVFALSAITASAALAVPKAEIVNGAGNAAVKGGFTSKSGAGVLTVAGKSIKCTADTENGKIVAGSTTKFEAVTVTFTGCGETAGGCKAHSPGKAAGTVETKSLKGALGTVAVGESATEVGLLLEPTAGTEVTTLEGPCYITTKLTGKVAGEVTPFNNLSLKGNVDFKAAVGKQKIKTITVGGIVVKPRLEAFGLEATEITLDENTFEEELKVI